MMQTVNKTLFSLTLGCHPWAKKGLFFEEKQWFFLTRGSILRKKKIKPLKRIYIKSSIYEWILGSRNSKFCFAKQELLAQG